MRERFVHYDLDLPGVPPGALRVDRFELHEALSLGFRAVLDVTLAAPPDAPSLLGASATFSLFFGADTQRAFHGVVTAADLAHPRDDAWTLRLELAPRLDRLRVGRTTRIFQELTVQTIIETVLTENGITEHDRRWLATASLPPRACVIQRDESDHTFLARLLAEEGVAFVVRHDEGRDVVTFFDDPGALLPIDGEPTLLYRDATGADAETVTALHERHALAPDDATLRDYDHALAGVDLTARDATGWATADTLHHPARFRDHATGQRLARRTLERLRLGARRFHGTSDCARLEPGRWFSLTGHPRSALDGDLMLVAVTHRGYHNIAQDGTTITYENDFEAIPKDVPFRPEVTALPTPAGVQLATVTSLPGEDVHPDEYGAVKVRFGWDRTRNDTVTSSPWLRVGQLALDGSLLTPRVGFEVIIDFERGDPDRTFVTGQLYNGARRPPYALPDEKTKSALQSATTHQGEGANELRFEDAAGLEEVLLNASMDLALAVENDAAWTVGRNATVTVGGESALAVTADHGTKVTKTRTLEVVESQLVEVQGDLSEAVGGNATVTVQGARRLRAGGDLVEHCKGTLTRDVGEAHRVAATRAYRREVVGTSTVETEADRVEVVSGSKLSNVDGDRAIEVAGGMLVHTRQMEVSTGGNVSVQADALEVRCGRNRTDHADGDVQLAADGELTAQVKTLTVEATSELTVTAGDCTIKLSASGSVHIKGDVVELADVKALHQAIQRSN